MQSPFILSWNDQAITLDPSSPWGYETKHAALHGKGRYVDAIDAFEAMISKIAQSPDHNIRGELHPQCGVKDLFVDII